MENIDNELNFDDDSLFWGEPQTPFEAAYLKFRNPTTLVVDESEALQKRLDRILNKLEKTPKEKLSLLKRFTSDLELKVQEFAGTHYPTIFTTFEDGLIGEAYPFEHVDFKNMKDIIWTNLDDTKISLTEYYSTNIEPTPYEIGLNKYHSTVIPYTEFEPIIYQKEKEIYQVYSNLVSLYERSIIEYVQLREDWEFIGTYDQTTSLSIDTKEAHNSLPTQIEQLFRCKEDYQKIINLLENNGIYLEAELDKERCGKGVITLHTLHKKGWIPKFNHQILTSINRRTLDTGISKETFYKNESASTIINKNGVDLSKIIPTYEQKE